MNRTDISRQRRLPYATIAIAAVNVIYFIYLLLSGALGTTSGMVDKGALLVVKGTYIGGWSQLFTSMFMHFDIQHIGGNLLIMVVIGAMLEERLGRVRFLFSYFVSGLAGNAATILWYCMLGKTVVSAGASGAVFGLVGTLFCLIFRNRGSIPGFSRSRMLIMLFLIIYSGYNNAGINTVAHVAGFLAGTLCGLLFNNIWKAWQEDRKDRPFTGT